MTKEQWPTVKLGDLYRKTRSTDPRKNPDHEYKLFSIPAYDSAKPERVQGRDVGSTKTILESGDVLLSKIVPHIQRVWVIAEAQNAIGSSEWIVLNDNRFDPDCLRHYLFSKEFHKRFLLTVAGVGGSLSRARPSAAARIEIPLPPLEEQRRIARVLGNCSKLHDQISGRKNLLESLFRSTTTSIFGNYSSTRKLEDFATVKTGPFGSMIHQSDYVSPGVPLINPQHIVNNKLSPSAEHQISSAKARTLEQYILRPGDIILGRRGQMGRAALVAMSDCPVICGTGCLIVRPHRIEDSVWLWAYLTGPLATQLLERAAIGATLPNLNSKIVSQLKVPSINSDLKSQIDQLHRTASRLLEKIDKSSVLTTELQASLYARAFNGKL